jgi:hypothetical protein
MGTWLHINPAVAVQVPREYGPHLSPYAPDRMSKLDACTRRRTSNTARRSTCVFVDMALFLASTSEGHLLCWSALHCFGLRTRKKMNGNKLRVADHDPPPPEQPGPKQLVQRDTSLAHVTSYPPMHHTKHNLQVTKKDISNAIVTFCYIIATPQIAHHIICWLKYTTN